MTGDRDDVSEALDGDKLGEGIGDDEMPGLADYPPDRYLGAEDPSLDGDDDLAVRDARREEHAFTIDADGVVLEDPNEPGRDDREAQELGSDVPGSAGPVAPEEAALHIVYDDDPTI
jgi:hypothetical protein